MFHLLDILPCKNVIFSVSFYVYLIIPVIIFALLFFIKAPYGKFTSESWGKLVNARLGWIIMESFAVIIFLAFMFIYRNTLTFTKIAFFVVWNMHYVYRAFIYQARIGKKELMSLGVSMSGMIFQIFNTFYQCVFIFAPSFNSLYANSYIAKPNFIIGIVMFFAGLLVNRQSDKILFNIKKNNGGKYGIPYGGMYKYITCPNYFGETFMWAGWFVMTFNLASFGFLIWTVSNLFPRAYSYHKWYNKEFSCYPKDRKRIIPFLW